jgi:hypothetical protein
MLQKVRTFTTAIHNALLEYTPREQRMLGIGLGALSVLCLAWPQIMEALVKLVGLMACDATIYVFVVLKERQEQGEEDDE